MYKNDCVAMVLAGGRGERLGALTQYYSKPAVHFGGNSRIIDFTLNNCRRSGIHTVGILSQYFSGSLSAYIGTVYSGSRERGLLHMLPPREGSQYIATADAVYKNIEFIDSYRPSHVIVLSGDHIYRMDYNELIAFHSKMGADVTVASTKVPLQEAYRYGILNAYPDGRVYGFEEKPNQPKSRLASMGIYVFKWDMLKAYLRSDKENSCSHHDFGKDIIPAMLGANESMYTYQFNGYWRDVGTLDSLWEANMDQLSAPPGFLIQDRISASMGITPSFLSGGAQVDRSIISGGCSIFGKVSRCVLADSVTVDEGAEIVDSVIMPGAYIGENAKLYKAIVGPGAKIMNHTEIGTDEGLDVFVDHELCRKDVSLIAPWAVIPEGMRIQKSSQVCVEHLQMWEEVLHAAAMQDYHPQYQMSLNRYGA